MPPRPSRPEVLIVDDEPQVAAALSDLLEHRYEVIREGSGAAALATLLRNDRISVVLSDQRMPGMTGDELFARAKEVSLASRVLITGYADIAAVIDAVNEGRIFGYVTKPWQRNDVMLTIGRAAQHCEMNRTIQHERELLHQLMDSSVDAIFFKDLAHRYIKVNAYTAEILGLDSAEAAEGRTAADFLAPERCAAREQHERELLRAGRPLRDCLELVESADGAERWLSTNLTPIRDHRGEVSGLVGITRDVTEARKLDELKDQFIATVRHELRTPLTAIQGAFGLLRSDAVGGLGDAGGRMVEIGWRNSGALIALVNDLLDTEAFETGALRLRPAPLDVSDVVVSAVAAHRDIALKANVALRADGAPGMEVLADRGRILQVLDKLIVNALAAAPRGSEVVCRARETDGRRVRVSVHDQGPGLAEGLRRHVFKKFTQVDSSSTRSRGGVGLGLYIAKSIVEAHGGIIDYVSGAGAGTEFFFELPLDGGEATAVA